jgi:hypothetical protein
VGEQLSFRSLLSLEYILEVKIIEKNKKKNWSKKKQNGGENQDGRQA